MSVFSVLWLKAVLAHILLHIINQLLPRLPSFFIVPPLWGMYKTIYFLVLPQMFFSQSHSSLTVFLCWWQHFLMLYTHLPLIQQYTLNSCLVIMFCFRLLANILIPYNRINLPIALQQSQVFFLIPILRVDVNPVPLLNIKNKSFPPFQSSPRTHINYPSLSLRVRFWRVYCN